MIQRAGLASQYINQDDVLRLKNLVGLTLKNYGNSPMTVTHNGVSETIPAYDVVNNYAESFELPVLAYPLDLIELRIVFVGKVGNAVCRYYQLKNCE